jgi:hypothetical protein
LWYKSNKNIRLFKKFTRNYDANKVAASSRLKRVAGLAENYFKRVSIKKYFKQKIFIRAKFLAHYHGVKNSKMRNR